jgi:predicted TIM-barrel fold metal-dependent hydrolase
MTTSASHESGKPVTQAAKYQLPESVAPFAGHINDVDTHEASPVSKWVDLFGSDAAYMVDAMFATESTVQGRPDKVVSLASVRDSDDTEITSETVWKSKLELAPGAWDFDRRLQVLDFTSVHRQIMYPGSLVLRSMFLFALADDRTFLKSITGDRRKLATRSIRAYNEWVVRMSRGQDRLRPAGVLIDQTPEDLVATAKNLIDRGVRALQIPTGRPPGGVSPAHPALDPLWDVLAATKTPLLSHIGSDGDVLRTLVWKDAPAFEGWKVGEEFAFDPWTLTSSHLGVQNFVATMILGGVFERHPDLFMASSEYGAHWIGPLAENMDLWVRNQPFPAVKGKSHLKLMPSEYVRRNIRVAPFYFEDVGGYIDRYGLEDVYCYGSDFPHHEGGKDPMGDFSKSLHAHGYGHDMMKKFFVDNAKVLIPD